MEEEKLLLRKEISGPRMNLPELLMVTTEKYCRRCWSLGLSFLSLDDDFFCFRVFFEEASEEVFDVEVGSFLVVDMDDFFAIFVGRFQRR